MTTKLEALEAVANWMGAYEGGFTGTLEAAYAAGDEENLAEFGEDMVAGYRLILAQIAAQHRADRIRAVVRSALRSNPNADPKRVRKLAAEAIDKAMEKTS